MLLFLISIVETGIKGGSADRPSKELLVDIARRARRYDPEAFAALFDIFFEKLRRYIYYQTGDLDVADDMACEVMEKALESIDGFTDRGGTIGSWMFGIARNLLARRRQLAGRTGTVELDEETAVDEEALTESLVLRNEGFEELYAAMNRLGNEQREVLLLRFMEGFDVRTVARVIGKKPGAVRVIQHRAIQALREILSPGEMQL